MTFDVIADWTRRLGAALLCSCTPVPDGRADNAQSSALLFSESPR